MLEFLKQYMGTTNRVGIGVVVPSRQANRLAESIPRLLKSFKIPSLIAPPLIVYDPWRCAGGEYTGPIISLESVRREDRGAYLCIAQNGVPPAVSRRIILQVKCKYTCTNI